MEGTARVGKKHPENNLKVYQRRMAESTMVHEYI